MEDPVLIKVYYENGAYSLEDLCNLVVIGILLLFKTDFINSTFIILNRLTLVNFTFMYNFYSFISI